MKYKKLSVFDQKSLDPETVSLDTAVNNNMFAPIVVSGTANYNIAASELKPDTNIVSHIFNLDDFDDIVPTGRDGWNDFTYEGEPNIKSLDISFESVSDKNKQLLKELIKAYNAKEQTVEEEDKYNYKAIYLKVPVYYSEAGILTDFNNYITFNLTNGLFTSNDNIKTYIFQFSVDNYTNIARINTQWDTFKTKVNTAFIQFKIEVLYESDEMIDVTSFSIQGDYFKFYTPGKDQFKLFDRYTLALPVKSNLYPNLSSPLRLTTGLHNNYITVDTKNEFDTAGLNSYSYCGTMITTATSLSPHGQEQLAIKDANTINCPYYNKDELYYYRPIHKSIFGENQTSLVDIAGDYHRNFARLYPDTAHGIHGKIPTKCKIDDVIYTRDIILVDSSTLYLNNKIDAYGNICTTINIAVSAEFLGDFFGSSEHQAGDRHAAAFAPIIGAFCYNKYYPSKYRHTYTADTVGIYLTSATQVLHSQSNAIAIKGHWDYSTTPATYNEIPYGVENNSPHLSIGLQVNGMNGQTLMAHDKLNYYIYPDDYFNRVTCHWQTYDTVPGLLYADNIEMINLEGDDGGFRPTDPSYVNSLKIIGNIEVNCITNASALK